MNLESSIFKQPVSSCRVVLREKILAPFVTIYEGLKREGLIDLKIDAITLAEIVVLIKHLHDFTIEDQEKIKNDMISHLKMVQEFDIGTPHYTSFDELRNALENIGKEA
jgi:hypothetical protein